MTSARDSLTARRDDIRVLLSELASICGILGEIATVWRRAKPSVPWLPLALPSQLQDAARSLAVELRAAADPELPGPPEAEFSVTDRFRALETRLAAAHTLTCGAGLPPPGDGGLWALVNLSLRRAEPRLVGADRDLITADG